MALYARSDLAYVIVPTSSGGCGEPHRRPVEHGAPAKIWNLACGLGCEESLRQNPHHWSATLSELPETYDETKSREDFTKRGAADRDQVMALALAKIAGVDLPETLRFALTGNMPDTPVEAMLECPSGHPSKPGSKFCAQCGEAMQQPVSATPAAAVLCPDGHPNAAAAKFCGECGTGMRPAAPARQAEGSTAGDTKVAGDAVTVVARGGDVPAAPETPDPASAATDDGESGEPDLTRLHWKSLERLCKDRGLDATGSKAALVARLSEPQPAGASA